LVWNYTRRAIRAATLQPQGKLIGQNQGNYRRLQQDQGPVQLTATAVSILEKLQKTLSHIFLYSTNLPAQRHMFLGQLAIAARKNCCSQGWGPGARSRLLAGYPHGHTYHDEKQRASTMVMLTSTWVGDR